MKKPADQKGLRARLTVIETGFNPSAYAALLKNDVNSSDNVDPGGINCKETTVRDNSTRTGQRECVYRA